MYASVGVLWDIYEPFNKAGFKILKLKFLHEMASERTTEMRLPKTRQKPDWRRTARPIP